MSLTFRIENGDGRLMFAPGTLEFLHSVLGTVKFVFLEKEDKLYIQCNDEQPVRATAQAIFATGGFIVGYVMGTERDTGAYLSPCDLITPQELK